MLAEKQQALGHLNHGRAVEEVVGKEAGVLLAHAQLPDSGHAI